MIVDVDIVHVIHDGIVVVEVKAGQGKVEWNMECIEGEVARSTTVVINMGIIIVGSKSL